MNTREPRTNIEHRKASVRWHWLALTMATASLMTGCAIPPADARKDADYQARASVADRPVVRPVRSVSSFSESLVCMDHMLREAELPTTLIASKQIVDFSGKVPVATKDMLTTSLSQMSRLSNAFRMVDYEVDIARQDTVQNLTTILLNNNQMQLQRPSLYISGAISFVDQSVINNSMDAGVSGDRVDAGYSRSRSATVIGLEMHLGDFRTRTLIPGLDAANEIITGGGGQGFDLGGRIGTYGVKFNVGRDYATGTGAALRTLVDLAMIELVGKWARVPYWQCLTLDQTHPLFQRQMHEWYEESGQAGRFQLLKASLMRHGYLPRQTGQPSEQLAVTSPVMRQALARFQVDRGLTPTGIIDFATYESALSKFVELREDGSLGRIGWSNSGPHQIDAAEGTNVAAMDLTKAAPWALDLQIENPQPAGERPAFTEGEQIFMSATVTRASHLYCYFVDSSGGVMRLLPNALQSHSLVSANHAVRIPDWMAPNPGFIVDAGRPGSEAAICLATAEEAMPKLPAEMQGPALATMPGVRGIEGVQQRFEAALGKDAFVGQALRWTVLPRRPQAAAAPQARPQTR